MTAPNGKTGHLGYRDYLLTYSWVASNVPTSEESGDRAGTTQRFTGRQLHWDGQANGSITVETLAPPPPPPVIWQEKYERLRAAVSAAIAAT